MAVILLPLAAGGNDAIAALFGGSFIGWMVAMIVSEFTKNKLWPSQSFKDSEEFKALKAEVAEIKSEMATAAGVMNGVQEILDNSDPISGQPRIYYPMDQRESQRRELELLEKISTNLVQLNANMTQLASNVKDLARRAT